MTESVPFFRLHLWSKYTRLVLITKFASRMQISLIHWRRNKFSNSYFQTSILYPAWHIWANFHHYFSFAFLSYFCDFIASSSLNVVNMNVAWVTGRKEIVASRLVPVAAKFTHIYRQNAEASGPQEHRENRVSGYITLCVNRYSFTALTDCNTILWRTTYSSE